MKNTRRLEWREKKILNNTRRSIHFHVLGQGLQEFYLKGENDLLFQTAASRETIKETRSRRIRDSWRSVLHHTNAEKDGRENWQPLKQPDRAPEWGELNREERSQRCTPSLASEPVLGQQGAKWDSSLEMPRPVAYYARLQRFKDNSATQTRTDQCR